MKRVPKIALGAIIGFLFIIFVIGFFGSGGTAYGLKDRVLLSSKGNGKLCTTGEFVEKTKKLHDPFNSSTWVWKRGGKDVSTAIGGLFGQAICERLIDEEKAQEIYALIEGDSSALRHKYRSYIFSKDKEGNIRLSFAIDGCEGYEDTAKYVQSVMQGEKPCVYDRTK